MFEDFSFSSPSATTKGDDRLMLDCDSTAISPLSSRCPSPSSFISRRPHPLSRPRSPYHRRPLQPPTSMPSNYEPSQRRISVGTLTEKLNAHTLQQHTTSNYPQQSADESPLSPVSPTSFSFSVTRDPLSSRASVRTLLTPPGGSDDEGYDDQQFPGWDNFPAGRQSLTSVPYESGDGFLDVPQHAHLSREPGLRSQRQQMARAQCHMDVVKLSLLTEDLNHRRFDSPGLSDDECHPSSLPPDTSPPSRRRSSVRPQGGGNVRCRSRISFEPGMLRRRSTSSAGTIASLTRVVKPRAARELLSKRSEQTLRRKSLVSATLAAAMNEASFSQLSSPGH